MNDMELKSSVLLKSAILQQLHTGKTKAILGKILADRLGERDTRQIRLVIQELREDGIPIIGSPKPPYGYFIAETVEECKENLEILTSYIEMLSIHRRALLKASEKRFSGQLTMGLK